MECESTTRPCIVRMQIEFIRSVGLEKGPSARNLKNATLGEMLLVDVCKAHPCPGPSCRFEGRDGRMSIEHGDDARERSRRSTGDRGWAWE